MPTQEEVDKAWKDWTPIDMIIYEECILCKKSYIWLELIIKVPEWVSMCVKCCEKYPDNKKYWWKKWWFFKYIVWEWIIDLPIADK